MKKTRDVESLPKNFNLVKKEFEKQKNIFLAKNCYYEENQNPRTFDVERKQFFTLENLALLYCLIAEFENYLNTQESGIVEQFKTLMDEKNEYEVLLGTYGKKVFYDKDANWFFIEEMTDSDWKKWDKKSNEEFLKKRKEQK